MQSRLLKILSLPRRYYGFLRDWRHFSKRLRDSGDDRFKSTGIKPMPALWDKVATTAFDAHYVYHTAWAVRTVIRLGPAVHVDISSSLYFCSALSASVPVEFYDYRPASLKLDGLTCGRQDLARLSFADNSLVSLSCMHTIEHVGLGRYGDPLDPLGDLKACAELRRVVEPGGHLIIVLPVGTPRLCFNAHRIYSHEQIVHMFEGFDLVETALVKDSGDFVQGPPKAAFDAQVYGCGCYLWRKPYRD